MATSTLRYDSLDHWRGIAAISVMLFHGFGSARIAGATVHDSIGWLAAIAAFGWFGVHLFFVISGYCIAANVNRLFIHERRVVDFLRDRFLRIYPTYWAACVAAVAVGALASIVNNAALSSSIPGDARTLIANALLIEPYLGVERLQILVSWSLVFELGFYAIMAAGFALFTRGVRAPFVAAFFLALALWGLSTQHSGLLYVLRYWPEFACGIAVFAVVWLRARGSSWWVPGALVPLTLAIAGALLLPDPPRVYQMAGAALFAMILVALHRWDDVIANHQALKWLSWIGVISYSLYLVHVPLGGRIVGLGSRWIPFDSPWFLALQAAYWVGSVAIAYVFFHLFESRFETWRKGLARRSRRASRDWLLGERSRAS